MKGYCSLFSDCRIRALRVASSNSSLIAKSYACVNIEFLAGIFTWQVDSRRYGAGYIAHTPSDLGTRWGELSASRPGRLYPQDRTPSTRPIGGWVGLRAGLGTETTRKALCPWNVSQIVESKAVPLHAMEALGGRGDIAPTHSRPRH
jgi:hypothetical protein